MDSDEAGEYLVDMGYATEEEVRLVAQINGDNLDSMESILYARAGYNSFDQLEDEEEDEDEDDN
jgi:hypothetical protein